MKGFVITLLSIMLVVMLVTFASVLHGNYLSMERVLEEPRPLMYASMLFDSVAQDVNAIVGPSIAFDERNASLALAIEDSLPKGNFTSDLSSYEAFLEGAVAEGTSSDIDANLSNLAPDDVDALINGRHTYANNGDEAYFAPDTGISPSAYELRIFVDGDRENLSTFTFDPHGDINVSLRYSDRNGSVSQDGKVKSGGSSIFSVNYSGGGRLDVLVGRAHGSDGAISVDANNASANFTLIATLPPLDSGDELGYEYDAWMSYSQGKISMERRIGK